MTDETGNPEEAVVDGQQTLSFQERLIATYERFAGLQQQKLVLAGYVVDRQAEIDDPATAAKATLAARYSHVDPTKFDEALERMRHSFETDDSHSIIANEDVATLFADLKGILPDGYARTVVLAYLQELLNTARPGGNTDDLMASLFTGLIADFESFMVSLFTDLYMSEPRPLASKDRVVSWGQIFQIDDLGAFREELIDQAVVDVMRGSLDDWMTALSRDHHIKTEPYASSPQLAEHFQRRHVLVHNGGRVSRLYIEKCPKVTVEPGEYLTVSPAYFNEAADRLGVLALALAVSSLIRLGDDGPLDRESRMADWVYELLLRRRYQAVYDYLSEVPFDRMEKVSAVEVCRVNLWLSMKRLGRFDECRGTVEEWQVDHLKDKFRLAKHALLGEIPEAAELCRELRDSDRLPLHHWVEWPLLEEVREHEAGSDQGVAEPDSSVLGLLESGIPSEGTVDEH